MGKDNVSIMILIGLIVNSLFIQVVSQSETTSRNGYANIQVWNGGVMIYAHNYLAGKEFYHLENITALYSNGSTQEMVVKDREVYTGTRWDEFITKYSSPETLTLVTCYPEVGTTSWRLIVELENQHERNETTTNRFIYDVR